MVTLNIETLGLFNNFVWEKVDVVGRCSSNLMLPW